MVQAAICDYILKQEKNTLKPEPLISHLKEQQNTLKPEPLISELRQEHKTLKPESLISELKEEHKTLKPEPQQATVKTFLRAVTALRSTHPFDCVQ